MKPLKWIKSRARALVIHHDVSRRAALELAKWDWDNYFSKVKFAIARGAQ
jgi:hypothetical protein